MHKKCKNCFPPSLPLCNFIYHRSFCDFFVEWDLFNYKSNSPHPSNHCTQNSFTFATYIEDNQPISANCLVYIHAERLISNIPLDEYIDLLALLRKGS